MAKKIISEFMKGRDYGPIGIVVFGDEAFTQCPLTIDYGILLTFVDQLEVGMAGDSTAIGSALGVCIQRLKDRESVSKVIVLLTDGRSNAGSVTPINAAKIAKSGNIKTYTIGVGREGRVPFPMNASDVKNIEYKSLDPDENTLKQIAEITGGYFYRAINKRGLKYLYNKIDGMEKKNLFRKNRSAKSGFCLLRRDVPAAIQYKLYV